ncbi:MAG: hypothetical protein JXB60_05645 [Candidatus Cloacimonetes bacterium]|nr:hypothetical protein [Candidatus Cloacimonadota bacterium]
MNLFIVVIPMLMTVMVSVHIAMIEITLPLAGTPPENIEDTKDLPPRVILALMQDRFEIMIDGKDETKIPVIDSLGILRYNYAALNDECRALKEKYEELNTIDILPDPQVKFDILLKSIDICKFNGFPNIKYLTSTKRLFRPKQQ